MPRDLEIANRLRGAGLHVVEVAGWQTRGSEYFYPLGSVDHHTAGGWGNAPSLGIVINGRSDLSGPLCNVLIARDNTCFVVAAGRANHAGRGGWNGISGNSRVYGVERENVGTVVEPWRSDQTETAAKCHAALIQGRAGPEWVCEHKEWAPTRKIDAHTILGYVMRARVGFYLMGGGSPVPTPTARRIPKALDIILVPWKPGHYWAVTSDGMVKVNHKEDFHGSMAGKKMNAPVTALIPTPTGKGYWLIGRDFGIFAFGDASKARKRPYAKFMTEYGRGDRAIIGGFCELRQGVTGLGAFDPKNWVLALVADSIPLSIYRV